MLLRLISHPAYHLPSSYSAIPRRLHSPPLLAYRINRVSSASAPAAMGESFRCRRGAREGEHRSIDLSLVREEVGIGLAEDLVFACVNV